MHAKRLHGRCEVIPTLVVQTAWNCRRLELLLPPAYVWPSHA